MGRTTTDAAVAVAVAAAGRRGIARWGGPVAMACLLGGARGDGVGSAIDSAALLLLLLICGYNFDLLYACVVGADRLSEGVPI